MPTVEQINELHRLHGGEHWSMRRIARHLHIGRHTLAKYLNTPAARPAPRQRTSKLDPFKRTIADRLAEDAEASAVVIAERLRTLGFHGGVSILKEYLHAARGQFHARRAYVRMEPAAGERFEIDWGHFGALDYQGDARKLYAFCRSSVITTHTAFSDWGNILCNTTIATAIADRLVENSEIFLLGGDSLRKSHKCQPPAE